MLTTTNPLGYTSYNTYDADGNLITAIDFNGLERTMTYDADGHETGETWYAANGTTVVNQINYTYDAAGNMLTASNNAGTYTMTYDGNRLATQTDPNGLTLSYGYDDNGNVTSVVESQGTTVLGTIASVYNDDNLLVSRSFTDENGQELNANLSYDESNNLASLARYNGSGTLVGSTQYTYDNNMVTEIQDLDGSGTQLADYQYSYNAGQLLTSETDNGTTTPYSYDATNQLVSAGSSSYAYDANGNRQMSGYVVGADNQILSDGTWTYTYDKQGNVIEKTQGIARTTWIYLYDNANHLVDAQEWSQDPNVSGQPTLISESQYVYDVFGNLLGTTVSAGGSSTTTRFAYDLNHNIWANWTVAVTCRRSMSGATSRTNCWRACLPAIA